MSRLDRLQRWKKHINAIETILTKLGFLDDVLTVKKYRDIAAKSAENRFHKQPASLLAGKKSDI